MLFSALLPVVVQLIVLALLVDLLREDWFAVHDQWRRSLIRPKQEQHAS